MEGCAFHREGLSRWLTWGVGRPDFIEWADLRLDGLNRIRGTMAGFGTPHNP